MNRSRLRLPDLLIALVAASAGCAEDPAAPTTQIAGQVPGGIAQQQPATPPPLSLASPRPNQDSPVATPTPPHVPSPPAPSPSPVMPGAPSPSPVAAASPSPGTSPSPDVSPSPLPAGYRKTGVKTDLAVSGPAYFVLSTKPTPAVIEDLLFTRDGRFKLVTETVGSLKQLRLKHAEHGFYVVGYAKHGDQVTEPDETDGVSESVLTTSWGAEPSRLAALSLDADRNAEAPDDLTFEANTGKLLVGSELPRGADGGPLTAYVGLAQLEKPDQLTAQSGYDGVYRFNPNAGRLFLGVARTGASRPVGNANFVLVGTLEGD